jgi:MYXO-CTERM domain-containing protein
VGLTLLLALGPPSAALANSTGIIDQYGPAKTCFTCHLPGQWMQGTINLLSPVYTKQTYTFSFVCSAPAGSGALPVAGINVHASCGTLSVHPTETKTKLVSGQITHSQPKAASGGTVTYKYNWTAPASTTGCAFSVTGLLGNNDKTSSGDVTCQAMKGLLVLPTPDGGPPPKLDTGVTPKKDTGVTPKKDTGTTPKQDTGGTPKKDGAPSPTDGGSSADGAVQGSDAAVQGFDAAPAGDLGVNPPPDPEDEGCGCIVGNASRGGGLALVLLLALGLILGRRVKLLARRPS